MKTMRHLEKRVVPSQEPLACLRMNFEDRQKARNRVVATNGEIVGVHIERGTSLKDGDCLADEEGIVFVVRAMSEELSVVRCADRQDLARVAYHLGNRHVRLQIGETSVAYAKDHVLDEMLQRFGFQVEHLDLPFEPEPGAYHRSSGHGSHSHGVEDSHGGEHSHAGSSSSQQEEGATGAA